MYMTFFCDSHMYSMCFFWMAECTFLFGNLKIQWLLICPVMGQTALILFWVITTTKNWLL